MKTKVVAEAVCKCGKRASELAVWTTGFHLSTRASRYFQPSACRHKSYRPSAHALQCSIYCSRFCVLVFFLDSLPCPLEQHQRTFSCSTVAHQSQMTPGKAPFLGTKFYGWTSDLWFFAAAEYSPSRYCQYSAIPAAFCSWRHGSFAEELHHIAARLGMGILKGETCAPTSPRAEKLTRGRFM